MNAHSKSHPVRMQAMQCMLSGAEKVVAAQDSMLLSAALACHDFAPFMVSVKSCAPRTRSLVLSRLGYPSAKSWLICLQVGNCRLVCAFQLLGLPACSLSRLVAGAQLQTGF